MSAATAEMDLPSSTPTSSAIPTCPAVWGSTSSPQSSDTGVACLWSEPNVLPEYASLAVTHAASDDSTYVATDVATDVATHVATDVATDDSLAT